ncbi:MAG: hypothetical protein ACLFP2_05355 [Candidatus Woesearchaeota archaeon]
MPDYETLAKQMDKRYSAKLYNQQFGDEPEGGVKKLLNDVYGNFAGTLDSFLIDINDAEESHSIVDSYLEEVLKQFEPDIYETIKPALDQQSTEDRRHYLKSLAASYTGVPMQLLEKATNEAYEKLTESGEVGTAIDIIENYLKHQEVGIAKQTALKEVQRELDDPESAFELLKYVSENYMGEHEIEENQLRLLASDKQRAMDYSQGVINGEMDPYFKNRYRISPN